MGYQDAALGEPPSVEPSRDLTGSQPVGTFAYFANGGRWDWSDGVAIMLGYHPEAVAPSLELLLQHTHFEDRTRVAGSLHRIVQGQRVSSRHRVIDCSGGLHWIVLVGDQVKNESGDILGVSGYFIDITDVVQRGVTAAVSELAKSRAIIEQAKGVLMAAYGIGADEAFDRLVQRSQEANVKLRDIAGQFVTTMSGKLSAGPQTDILRTATPMAATRRQESSAGRLPAPWTE